MVKGNRKAKRAARDFQRSTGSGYARSRRVTVGKNSVKCQVCNNTTKNPSGRCYLHENGAPNTGVEKSASIPQPSLNTGSSIPRPGEIDYGDMKLKKEGSEGKQSHYEVALADGRQVTVMHTTGEEGHETSGDELSDEEHDQLDRQLDRSLVRSGELPIGTSEETARVALDCNSKIRDYYVNDKLGTLVDGWRASKLPAKNQERRARAEKEVQGLSYTTMDNEASILWNVDLNERDDDPQFWDRYNELSDNLNRVSTQDALDTWGRMTTEQKIALKAAREHWQREAAESYASDYYYHQLDWSNGLNTAYWDWNPPEGQ